MIFTMTEQVKDQNRNVLVSSILISSLLAYVLIDSGTTHSFISFKFVHKLGVMVTARFSVVVFIPSRNTLNIDHVVKTTMIEIDGRSLKMELYVIDINEFDVILRVDGYPRTK